MFKQKIVLSNAGDDYDDDDDENDNGDGYDSIICQFYVSLLYFYLFSFYESLIIHFFYFFPFHSSNQVSIVLL